jgi:hypothetical protein
MIAAYRTLKQAWIGLVTTAVVVSGAIAHSQSSETNIAMEQVNTFDCPAQPDGEIGSTPQNPRPTSYFDLYEFYPLAVERMETPPLHCQWIEIDGHFRSFEHTMYDGKLYPDMLGFYGHTTPITILDLVDEQSAIIPYQAADLVIVGRAISSCAADPEGWFPPYRPVNAQGLCDRGNLHWVLDEIHTIEALTEPGQRLRGEINRETLGELALKADDWSGHAAAREVLVDWFSTMRAGAGAFLLASNEYENAPAAIRERMVESYDWDSTSWEYMVSQNETSSFLAPSFDIETAPIGLFDSTSDTIFPETSATACLCATADCTDLWPLMHADVYLAHIDYICVDIRQQIDGTWTWH